MSRMAVVLVAAAGLAATCTPGPTAPAAPVASPVTPTTLDMGPIDVATYADVVPEPVTTTTTVAEPVTTVAPRVRAVPTTVPYEPPTPQSKSTRQGNSPPEYIKQCESGGSYTAVNPSSGAGGAWQFLESTWRSVGGTGRPQDATPEEQDNRAAILWDGGRGAGHWACS